MYAHECMHVSPPTVPRNNSDNTDTVEWIYVGLYVHFQYLIEFWGIVDSLRCFAAAVWSFDLSSVVSPTGVQPLSVCQWLCEQMLIFFTNLQPGKGGRCSRVSVSSFHSSLSYDFMQCKKDFWSVMISVMIGDFHLFSLDDFPADGGKVEPSTLK